MRLYFVRHAAAIMADEWPDGDESRPLTPEGKAQARLVGETLAGLRVAPDHLLTSPLRRAAETAEILAARLHHQTKPEEEARLGPGFHLPLLGEILADYPEAESLLLVGHEPDFSRTIGELTGGQVVVKKGGLALVELADAKALNGSLVWLAPPKLLKG